LDKSAQAKLEAFYKKLGFKASKDGSFVYKAKKPTTNYYGGFFLLDPNFWQTNFGARSYVAQDAKQLYNFLKNKIGETSTTWEMINTAEFRDFMTGSVTPAHVKRWIEEHSPVLKIDTFKLHGGEFMSGNEAMLLEQRYSQLRYSFWDYLSQDGQNALGAAVNEALVNGKETPRFKSFRDKAIDSDMYSRKEFAEQVDEYLDVAIKYSQEEKLQSEYAQWAFVAGKSEEWLKAHDYQEGSISIQPHEVGKPRPFSPDKGTGFFQDQHVPFPNNTVAHWRGFTVSGKELKSFNPGAFDTLPDEAKVFWIEEVQSDWAQKVRETKAELAESTLPQTKERLSWSLKAMGHPLLKESNRIGIKAAIEKAREKGATHVVVSDAETAMMSEGHDLQHRQPNQQFTTTIVGTSFTAERGSSAYKEFSIDSLKDWPIPNTGGAKSTGVVRIFPGSLHSQIIFEGEVPYTTTDAKGKIVNKTMKDFWTPVQRDSSPSKAVWDAKLKELGFEHKDTTPPYPDPTWQPPQAGGMRFNYNNALPKILEDLTGSKGQRVSLGEQTKAFKQQTQTLEEKIDYFSGYQRRATQGMTEEAKTNWLNTDSYALQLQKEIAELEKNRPNALLRDNLVFESAPGVKKTDMTGNMFELQKVKEDFTMLGKDKPNPKMIKSAVDCLGRTAL